MKRSLLITAPLAVLIAAFAAITANANTSTARHPTIIRLDTKRTSLKVIQATPPGRSPGDFALLAGDLLTPGTTRTIGHYQGVCFIINPPSNSECTFTYALAGGQITSLAAYGKNFNGENVVHEALVGGTHAYSNARGESIGQENSDTTGTETLYVTQ